MAVDQPRLQLHMEPREPIEIKELTDALGSLARQYQDFAVENNLAAKTSDARLLVSSVAPGSIDINFVPDLAFAATQAGPLLAPLIDQVDLIVKFGGHLKSLLDFFRKKEEKALTEAISVKDCDDAVNILKPIAQHGGSQTFNVINGPVTQNLLSIDATEAIRIIEVASQYKSLLQNPDGEKRQRVPLVWKRLDRDKATTDGKSSPDRGVIEEIDPKPHAVFFTDEMTPIKKQMIDDEEKPFQHVYFVDVDVSRVSGKVVSYRITGYHGKEELEPLSPA
jgi:hypothetical protein